MPFLAAIPAVLGAAGIGGAAMSTAATVMSGLAGAFGLAQGIAQGDPLGATLSALSGVAGGMGGLGGLGGAAASTAPSVGQAATSAAQSVSNAASSVGGGLLSAASPMVAGAAIDPSAGQSLVSSAPTTSTAVGPTAGQTVGQAGAPKALASDVSAAPMDAVNQGAQDIANAAGSIAPASSSGMGVGEMIGMGLQGAMNATEGVMALINAFRGPKKPGSGARMGLGALDSNLPQFGGGQATDLPNIPRIDISASGELPKLDLPEFNNNELLLKLLGAYQA